MEVKIISFRNCLQPKGMRHPLLLSSIFCFQSSNIFLLNSEKWICYKHLICDTKHRVNMYVVHSCKRLNISGNSSPTFKRKDFVSKGIGTGVFLWGATSKRDSMWHSPVFTCIKANRIPVKIYKIKNCLNYAEMWMHILCLIFLLPVSRTLLVSTFVIHLTEAHLHRFWLLQG